MSEFKYWEFIVSVDVGIEAELKQSLEEGETIVGGLVKLWGCRTTVIEGERSVRGKYWG